MLKQLTISNYAIIDSLTVEFDSGFITVTGETGAGKSVILGALGLVLGERADLNIIRNSDKKAVVEADFTVGDFGLNELFERHDLDYDPHTIIRREITPSGKSRAFVNDTPVKLSVLKDIGARLVDIHSQNETQSLRDEDFQLEIVDRFAGISNEVADYSALFLKHKKLRSELETLIEREKKARAEIDFLEFQAGELEEALIPADDFHELEAKMKSLEHAEEIKAALYEAEQIVQGSEENSVAALRTALGSLSGVKDYSPAINDLYERLNSALIELEDIGNELMKESGEVDVDPAESEQARERLDEIYRLQHKHQVQSYEELLQIHENINMQLQSVSQMSGELSSLESEVNKLYGELKSKADNISKKRGSAFQGLEKEILRIIGALGMEKARFQVSSVEKDQLSQKGKDRIAFMFSANPGSDPRELSRVASGGELSRVMLALKYVLSMHKKMPAIIFDEIDTGVSGKVAGMLASVLTELAANMQVIAITHLPQVAARGKRHLRVSKKELNGETLTSLRVLTDDERVTELAEMLSGKKQSEAAVNNARELLAAN